MTANSKRHGGLRPNAGRKIRLNLHFEVDGARSIYLLTKHQRAETGNKTLTEEQVVLELVEEKWRQIQRDYEGAEAKEPFIL